MPPADAPVAAILAAAMAVYSALRELFGAKRASAPARARALRRGVDEIVAAMKQAHPEVVCEFDENDEDMVDDDTDPQELQAYSEGFDEELARSFEKL